MSSTSKLQLSTPRFTVAALIAAASIACAIPAMAADATATAGGTVIAPIAIVVGTNLAFGSFAPGLGGSITVSTSGARSASGVIMTGAASASAARFNITGEAGSTYAITHAGTTTLTNTTGAGGETMALSKFSDLSGANAVSGNVATGTLDGAGAQSLYVGGTLTVAANQVAGVYAGTVIATVEYN